MIYGIDISNFQSAALPTTSDGHAVDFVFVKATEGHTVTNARHPAQVAAGRAAEAVVGHYHFLWPGNIAAQAAYFVSHCDLKPGEVLGVDWETTEAHTYASNAEKDAFVAAVKKLVPGHKVGLYCNLDFWKHHDSTSDCGDFLWIADPDRPAGDPDVVHPWTVHQYSDRNGLDRNVATFASRAAMKAWAGYPAPVPPPPPPPPAAPAVKDQVAAIEKTFATLTAQLAMLKKSVGL